MFKNAMNDKYKQLTRNTIILGIGTFGTKALSFVLIPLYTALLTTSDYGIAEIITTTITLSLYILTLNISDGVLRFVIEDEKKKEKSLAIGLKVIFFGFVVLIAGIMIADFFEIAEAYFDYFIFIIIGYVGNATYLLFNCYLQGLNKIVDVAVAGVIQTISMIGLNMILLVVFRMGLAAYLVGLTISPLIGGIYEILVVIKNKLIDFRLFNIDRDLQKSLIIYCIPLVFNSVAWWVNAGLDRYFVTGICGADQNGLYSAASKLSTIITVVMSIFLQAWGMSAVREYDPEDKDGFFSKTYSLFNTTAILMCTFITILNILISRVMFSGDFFVDWLGCSAH